MWECFSGHLAFVVQRKCLIFHFQAITLNLNIWDLGLKTLQEPFGCTCRLCLSLFEDTLHTIYNHITTTILKPYPYSFFPI